MSVITPCAEEAACRHILAGQVARYPRLALVDLYKLIYQAALGSEHAIHDVAAARNWLNRELAALGEGQNEPILDPISPNGHIVRVHLRPYIAAGGDPVTLLNAFIRTANEYRGSQATLVRYWSYAKRLAETGELPFPPAALASFLAGAQAQQFPAMHHSPAYRETYHPAYRVIARHFLPWP